MLFPGGSKVILIGGNLKFANSDFDSSQKSVIANGFSFYDILIRIQSD